MKDKVKQEKKSMNQEPNSLKEVPKDFSKKKRDDPSFDITVVEKPTKTGDLPVCANQV